MTYASTLAPAWVEDGAAAVRRCVLLGERDGVGPLPEGSYSMRGAGGQSATMIPTHELVVVRLGKYTGARAGGRALDAAFELLMEAVPPITQ